MTQGPDGCEPAHRCRFCGAVLAGRHAPPRRGVCAHAACRSQLVREDAERTAQRQWSETLRRSREQIADAAAEVIAGARALDQPVDNVLPVAVPLLDRPMVPLGDADRRLMAEHLDRIVADSFAAGLPDQIAPGRDDREAPVSRYVAAACATCKGACCEVGRTYLAFLTAETITQYRRHVPRLSPGQVRERYLERLPDAIAEGSCYFHGASGCTLDREQRDDVCHRHLCQQIRTQLDARIPEEPGPFVIVAADEHGNRAVTLLDQSKGARPLPGGPHRGPGTAGAERIAEHALARFPPAPPALRINHAPHAPLCTWCGRPVTPSQAAIGGSCGRQACERARLAQARR